MKENELKRVERRRPSVELNLVPDRRVRSALSRRGCTSFLSGSVLLLVLGGAVTARFVGLA